MGGRVCGSLAPCWSGAPGSAQFARGVGGLGLQTSILILQGGHLEELKETLWAALPALFGAVGVSILLGVLAVIPPSALRGAPITEFIAPRRRELRLVAVSIAFSTAIALAVVFWAL